jgi:hypothetical protein
VVKISDKYILLFVLVFVISAGCIATNKQVAPTEREATTPVMTTEVQPVITEEKLSPKEEIIQEKIVLPEEKLSSKENLSVAVEVDYRKYVDWFNTYNLNIRAYTPQEYVCGQYTVDMINASKKAGFHAYFAAVKFSDGTGHALVAFKSTRFNYTSWYFFEPQTNDQMTTETIAQILNEKMGRTVTEVFVYGYFDDAGDKDPTTWRFAYLLYNKKF